MAHLHGISDDILIYSKTFEGHLLSLKKGVFKNPICRPETKSKKCHLVRDHVLDHDLFGSRCLSKVLQPDARNTEKVLNWPVPLFPSEVKGFVGLTIVLFIDNLLGAFLNILLH